MMAVVVKLIATRQTAATRMHLFYHQCAPGGDGVLIAQHVPGKIERFAHHLSHIPNTQAHLKCTNGVLMAHRVSHGVEHAAHNAQLMHGRHPLPSTQAASRRKA